MQINGIAYITQGDVVKVDGFRSLTPAAVRAFEALGLLTGVIDPANRRRVLYRRSDVLQLGKLLQRGLRQAQESRNRN